MRVCRSHWTYSTGRDKKCLVLYDRGADKFIACARLVQSKIGKDMFWRIYRSPQAMACPKEQLTKEERLVYVGKVRVIDLIGSRLSSFMCPSYGVLCPKLSERF